MNNESIQPESNFGIIQTYFTWAKEALFSPTTFYRSVPLRGGLSTPLTIAIISAWIGEGFSFLWKSTLMSFLGLGGSEEFFKRLKFELSHLPSGMDTNYFDSMNQLSSVMGTLSWFFGVVGVLIQPFISLVGIFIISGLIFIGSSWLVPSGVDRTGNTLRFETSLRIVSYAYFACLFKVIPLMGGLISSLFLLILVWKGIQEVYRVSSKRAMVITTFMYLPELLLMFLVFFGLFAFILNFS